MYFCQNGDCEHFYPAGYPSTYPYCEQCTIEAFNQLPEILQKYFTHKFELLEDKIDRLEQELDTRT